jgi:hypothetical protein
MAPSAHRTSTIPDIATLPTDVLAFIERLHERRRAFI